MLLRDLKKKEKKLKCPKEQKMVEKTINEEEFDYILKKKILSEKNRICSLCFWRTRQFGSSVFNEPMVKKEKGCSTVIHFNHNLKGIETRRTICQKVL